MQSCGSVIYGEMWDVLDPNRAAAAGNCLQGPMSPERDYFSNKGTELAPAIHSPDVPDFLLLPSSEGWRLRSPRRVPLWPVGSQRGFTAQLDIAYLSNLTGALETTQRT